MVALPFRPVDVAKQAKDRRLAERGATDGSNNIPASGATELALAEQEVLTDVFAERDRYANDLASQLRAYQDGLSTLQTGMRVADMRQTADDAITRLREIRSLWSAEIAELHTKAVQATSELHDFKQKHRIARPPRLPDNWFMSFALLIFFVVMESILNGFLFASGSDMGLLGGVVLALSLSTLNVAMGVLNGFIFLRLKNSAQWLISVPAMAVSISLMALLVGFNGFVAHYRDLYQLSGDAIRTQAVWAKFVSTPLELESLYSWLLFAAGLLFSGAATWKGYGFDDPLPGYGAAERRRAAAVSAYTEERRGLIEEAAEIIADYSEEARNTIETLKAASSQRQQILGARSRMVAEYRSIEANLQQSGQQLLRIYRQSNTSSRTTPPPAHFGDGFAFPGSATDRPEFKLLLTDQGLEHDAESLIAELDKLRNSVIAEHDLVLGQAPGRV